MFVFLKINYRKRYFAENIKVYITLISCLVEGSFSSKLKILRHNFKRSNEWNHSA